MSGSLYPPPHQSDREFTGEVDITVGRKIAAGDHHSLYVLRSADADRRTDCQESAQLALGADEIDGDVRLGAHR
jgi:hypothetical protein